MLERNLTALPVFNEEANVCSVLAQVRRYSGDVLVVDDGSTDSTARLLGQLQAAHGAPHHRLQVVRHRENRGYGAALMTAFDYARGHGYQTVVTIDCDGQHEPQRIPQFVEACRHVDIVSGSRYLQQFPGDDAPPTDRRRINQLITAELNRRLCLDLTDAFCGFKAYRVDVLERLRLTEKGYAMPLELWVEAARAGMRIRELPVPLIYLDEKRSFGGVLDTAEIRLQYYHLVLDRSMAAAASHVAPGEVWAGTLCGDFAG